MKGVKIKREEPKTSIEIPTRAFNSIKGVAEMEGRPVEQMIEQALLLMASAIIRGNLHWPYSDNFISQQKALQNFTNIMEDASNKVDWVEKGRPVVEAKSLVAAFRLYRDARHSRVLLV